MRFTIGQVILGSGLLMLALFGVVWLSMRIVGAHPFLEVFAAFVFLIPGAIVTPIGFVWWLIESLGRQPTTP